MMSHLENLIITWSPIYHPEWDATPEAYLDAGIVQWGHSRRLAHGVDLAYTFKAYIGVHHSTWGESETTRFFLSLFLGGRTIALRTFPTLPEALAEMYTFYARLDGGHFE